MLDQLNEEALQTVIDAVVPLKKKQGDTVIQQGEDGDNFYILESGQLECKKLEAEKEIKLKNYNPGETFGELSLLYNAPQAASISVLSEECELFSLDRVTFNSILRQHTLQQPYDNQKIV